MYSQLPSISGGRSSIRNLRTRHAVVTGTHLSRDEVRNEAQNTIYDTNILPFVTKVAYLALYERSTKKCHVSPFGGKVQYILVPPSSAEVKERVELYLYSLSGPLWPVLGRTLALPVSYVDLNEVSTRDEE
jgi:hypothetical protein